MKTSRLLDELVLHTTAFADAVRAADPSAAVAACPDWTVRDLAAHLGGVHRWAADTVAARRQKLARRGVTDPPMPDVEDELSAWLLTGAAQVAEAVRSVGEDTVVGGFGGPVPVAFWARRQCHETLVHRGDAELAAGRVPWSDVAPDVAADCVDEHLELVLLGAKYRPDLAGDGQTLHLHATDDGLGDAGEWVITRDARGLRVEHGHQKADVAVRGPATALLGVVTSRQSPDDAGVEVLGDAELLAHWRTHATI